jgi:hypothetical protein
MYCMLRQSELYLKCAVCCFSLNIQPSPRRRRGIRKKMDTASESRHTCGFPSWKNPVEAYLGLGRYAYMQRPLRPKRLVLDYARTAMGPFWSGHSLTTGCMHSNRRLQLSLLCGGFGGGTFAIHGSKVWMGLLEIWAPHKFQPGSQLGLLRGDISKPLQNQLHTLCWNFVSFLLIPKKTHLFNLVNLNDV